MKSVRLTVEEATARAEALCARAERCSHEILTRLASWGLSSSQASSVIDSLVSRRYIDDARFAAAFVRDKYRFARWGRRKIDLALRARRIPAPIIREALLEIDPDLYSSQLVAVLRSKARAMGPEMTDTFDGRTRLFRHAASRGFEPDLISLLISSRAYLPDEADLSNDYDAD
ncbi:MAG: RecX family transcriptional regulator [Muribaculaceae bacterium]|nr:RecX family transcriptional regulator [Muribaculaceae bacterium]